MNLGQMLLVMLAVVLFSSVVITMYNSMTIQIEMATNNIFYSQGIFIADSILKRFEAELLTEMLDFVEFEAMGNPTPYVVQPPFVIGDAVYTVQFITRWSGPDGEVLITPDSSYVFQRCIVTIEYGDAPPLVVGIDDDAFRKVHTRF